MRLPAGSNERMTTLLQPHIKARTGRGVRMVALSSKRNCLSTVW
jgi:hypothetical protein